MRQLILADNQVIFLHRDIKKNGLKSFFSEESPRFLRNRVLLLPTAKRLKADKNKGQLTMVTMEFIAQKTGLSRYTISRALSGNPKVLPKTRERILQVCEKYGYVPNSNAVGLVKGRTNLIGVVVPYLTDDFYSEFIDALDRTAREHNYQLIYRSSYNDGKLEAEIIKNFLALKVCALIVVPVVVNPDRRVHDLAGKNVPVVYFDRPLSPDRYHVINDNREGVRQITAMLLAAGRRPAYLGSFYRDSNITAREREDGYCAAMKAQRHPPVLLDCSHSHEQQDNEQFGYDNLHWTIEQHQVPDAVVCVTDAVALGAIRALKEAGLAPGQDVLVAGHDNLRFSAFLSPALTTVRQRKDQFAVTCIEIIDQCLKGQPPIRKKYLFAPEIIRRESA